MSERAERVLVCRSARVCFWAKTGLMHRSKICHSITPPASASGAISYCPRCVDCRGRCSYRLGRAAARIGANSSTRLRSGATASYRTTSHTLNQPLNSRVHSKKPSTGTMQRRLR